MNSVSHGKHRTGVRRAALVSLAAVALVGVMATSGTTAPGNTTLISDDGCCAASDGESTFASMSVTGRYVAFASDATNLGAGDTESLHVYLRDRDTDEDGIFDEPDTVQNEVISVDSDGIPGRGGIAQEASVAPVVSDNGRYVVFESPMTTLVPGDTNARPDIFIRDRGTATIAPSTERVSVNSAGQQATGGALAASEALGRPADVSNNGRYVAFHSTATNLVPGDTNLRSDVFVRDRGTATIEPSTERVSVTTSGQQASGTGQGEGSGFPSISGDGRYVAFQTDAQNLSPPPDAEPGEGLLGVVVRDRQLGTTTRVSVNSGEAPANMESGLPSISDDGNFVAFESLADNLNPLSAGGDPNLGPDVFVRDRAAGTTQMVSVNNSGQPVGGPTNPVKYGGSASISNTGRYVAFHSDAALVSGDTNKLPDIFVRDRQSGTTQRTSVSSSGAQIPAAAKGAEIPSISGNGKHVAFESDAVLVQGDLNGKKDIFAHELRDSTTPPPTGTAPRVTAVTPAENATLVGPATNVTATFSEAVRRGPVTNPANFTLVEEGTIDPIDAEITYDPATKKATLNPFGPGVGENLTRGATYTATIRTPQVKDLDGVPLDQNPTQTGNQPKIWSFTIR